MLNYTDITQTPISKVERLRRYWPENFETLTAVTLIDYQIHIKTGTNMWFLLCEYLYLTSN